MWGSLEEVIAEVAWQAMVEKGRQQERDLPLWRSPGLNKAIWVFWLQKVRVLSLLMFGFLICILFHIMCICVGVCVWICACRLHYWGSIIWCSGSRVMFIMIYLFLVHFWAHRKNILEKKIMLKCIELENKKTTWKMLCLIQLRLWSSLDLTMATDNWICNWQLYFIERNGAPQLHL